MSAPTQSAVIVPVPEAEPVVAEHRRHLDRAAGWGVPAHVTVLYPFLPPDRLTRRRIDELAAAVASVPAFDCELAEVGWFGDDVAWLRPDPGAHRAFNALTGAVFAAFPDHPPYAGAFGLDDLVPHLTIGESQVGGLAAVRKAAATVAPRLPIRARVAEAILIAGSEAPDSWSQVARLPLA